MCTYRTCPPCTLSIERGAICMKKLDQLEKRMNKQKKKFEKFLRSPMSFVGKISPSSTYSIWEKHVQVISQIETELGKLGVENGRTKKLAKELKQLKSMKKRREFNYSESVLSAAGIEFDREKPAPAPTPETLDQRLIAIADMYQQVALEQIKDRRYEIPEDCKIEIGSPLDKEFLYAMITEDAGKYRAQVFPQNFFMDLGQEQKGQLGLLRVFLLCAIADMVKNRENTASASGKEKVGRTDSQSRPRSYPTKSSSSPSTNSGNRKVKGHYVVGHFRISENYSQKALAAALSAGFPGIPAGYTYVSSHIRGNRSDVSVTEIRSQLAESFLKSIM